MAEEIFTLKMQAIEKDMEIARLRAQADSLMDGNIELLGVIRQYRDAERKGQLVRLPIEPGTPVFRIGITCEECPEDRACDKCLEWDSLVVECAYTPFMYFIDEPIYLTREEAEAALTAQETM